MRGTSPRCSAVSATLGNSAASQWVDTIRKALGEHAFTAAVEQGLRMEPPELVAYAPEEPLEP